VVLNPENWLDIKSMELHELTPFHHYKIVAKAIRFVMEKQANQTTLDDIARNVHLSADHFHKIFSEWAGTTPKKFFQCVSRHHTKHILENSRNINLNDEVDSGNFSSINRLHDLFVKIEGMSPAEYSNRANNLNISYSFSTGPFGQVLIASTAKGICFLAFIEDAEQGLLELKNKFPDAQFRLKRDENQIRALSAIALKPKQLPVIKLHLKGTEFQLKVWQALLKIPTGNLSTYGSVANEIGNPNSQRAVGTAIGQNPVAYLVPCHRVIRATGELGGYMWGETRKKIIIGWEASLHTFND